MKFWEENKIDKEFDMPVSEVADQFVTWYHSNPDNEGLMVERLLRWWLTSPEHFNSVWVSEIGTDSFEELLDIVIGKIFRTTP